MALAARQRRGRRRDMPGRSVSSGSWVRSSRRLDAIDRLHRPTECARRCRSTPQNGPRALHRRLGHARRADPAGPDRQRPRQRVDARLQGRPHVAARRSATCCSPTRATGATVGPQSTAVQVDKIVDRLLRQARPRDGRAARLRDQRRGLLRRPDRAGHALHAQRPVHARPAGPARDRPGRPGARPPTGARSRVGADGRVDPRAHRRRQRSTTRSRRATRWSPARPRAPPRAPCASGALEGSGADPARSMVDMISSHARLRGRPEGHPDDRRDARQGRSQVGSVGSCRRPAGSLDHGRHPGA